MTDVALIREAARLMRRGHVPTATDWRRIAELMDAAATREARHLAAAKQLPAGVMPDDNLPTVGDEAWIVVELARAYLGRDSRTADRAASSDRTATATGTA